MVYVMEFPTKIANIDDFGVQYPYFSTPPYCFERTNQPNGRFYQSLRVDLGL
jgi:hypothetical protein